MIHFVPLYFQPGDGVQIDARAAMQAGTGLTGSLWLLVAQIYLYQPSSYGCVQLESVAVSICLGEAFQQLSVIEREANAET